VVSNWKVALDPPLTVTLEGDDFKPRMTTLSTTGTAGYRNLPLEVNDPAKKFEAALKLIKVVLTGFKVSPSSL